MPDDLDDWPPPPAPCPACGALAGVVIVGGLPNDEAWLAVSRGMAHLGGCLVGGQDPERHCTACGHEWTPPDLPLWGRTAVVTGVSRQRGIGFAVASRLARMGANLAVQHWAAHDADQPWGDEPVDRVVERLEDELAAGARITDLSLDLTAPDAGEELIARASAGLGHLDILVCNHARSGGDGVLADQTAETLDAHWAVNTRATLLATKAFAAQHDGREGGRVVWFTSGQALGPMPDEIAYAASKAALAGITPSVADWLIERGIVLNTVNPGPVNTGYLDESATDRSDRLDEIRARFPTGRFGEPDDPARLVAWLVSDEGRWMVGQVLSSEGGFRRW